METIYCVTSIGKLNGETHIEYVGTKADTAFKIMDYFKHEKSDRESKLQLWQNGDYVRELLK